MRNKSEYELKRGNHACIIGLIVYIVACTCIAAITYLQIHGFIPPVFIDI